jgi:hypothetical protein
MPRKMVFIGRHGQATTIPDMSIETVQKASRSSGLDELMASGSNDPAVLLSAFMEFQQEMGVTRKMMTPEEAEELLTDTEEPKPNEVDHSSDDDIDCDF